MFSFRQDIDNIGAETSGKSPYDQRVSLKSKNDENEVQTSYKILLEMLEPSGGLQSK